MSLHNRTYYGGDPFESTGFWGSPSSTANFCEEDYAVTKYIAEFINTLTNLTYVYYAFKLPSRSGEKSSFREMDAMSASLVLVGVFSFIFHASLHRETQFLDEMSMFFLGSSFLQPLYTTGYSARAQTAITTILVSIIIAISAVYYQTRIVELHWGSFFIIENLIWTRALYLVYYRPRRDGEVAKLLRQFWSATGVMVVALIVWAVDLGLCPPLRQLRAAVGMPWAVLLELHGWWHILTAVAASKYIELIREITL